MPVIVSHDVAPRGVNFERSYPDYLATATTAGGLPFHQGTWITPEATFTSIIEVTCTVVTSATVANRQVQVQAAYGSSGLNFKWLAPNNHVASTTFQYVFGTYLTAHTTGTAVISVAMPMILLPPASLVTVIIGNAAAADAISLMVGSFNHYPWDATGDAQLLGLSNQVTSDENAAVSLAIV